MELISALSEAEQSGILPSIFKFLPVDDRKNVRLACELWYRECNRPEIVEEEKFVFRLGNDGDGMEKMGNFLIACETLRTSFEFQALPVKLLPRQVWEHCGPTLQSLFIHDCDLDDETMKNMILCCTQLTHLYMEKLYEVLQDEEPGSIIYPDDVTYLGGMTFVSEEILDELIEQKFEQRKLESFTLHLSIRMPTRMYRKFFTIYPCLKTFNHGFRPSLHSINRRINFNEHHYFTSEEFVFPSTVEHFTSNELNFFKEGWQDYKFKSFETLLYVNPFYGTWFKEILSVPFHRTELKKLHLFTWVSERDSSWAISFFLHTLLHLPRLIDLQFYCRRISFSFTCEEFSSFLMNINKLESLTLICSGGLKLNDDSHPFESWSLPYTQYFALKYLRLANDVDERIPFEILSRCRASLRHLYLHSVTDEMMQKIFEIHIKLRTLRLFNPKCTSKSFIGSISSGDCASSSRNVTTYSFRRLRSLMHLQLIPLTADILDAFLLDFDFPNLRYFYFTIELMRETDDANVRYYEPSQRYNVMRKILETVSTRAPRLEILRFNASFLSAADLVDYCRRLKYLKFLFINTLTLENADSLVGPQIFAENLESVERLFNECPSLCWVVNHRPEGDCSYYHGYYRDHSSGSVMRRNLPWLVHKHFIENDEA